MCQKCNGKGTKRIYSRWGDDFVEVSCDHKDRHEELKKHYEDSIAYLRSTAEDVYGKEIYLKGKK